MTRNVDTLYPVTPLQHGMLHHSQLDRASGVYVEQFSCVLEGELDAGRFQAAWTDAVHRHDVLKTMFIRLHEEKPVQVVRQQVALPFHRLDWRAIPAEEQERRFESLLAQDRRAGFDPSIAPLMRLHLADLGGRRHRFLWTYHHAILDGWSMPVLLKEVFDRYASAAPAPPARGDYRHYVAWLRAQDMDQARDFWRGRLHGYRVPLDFALPLAPAAVSAAAAGSAAVPRRLARVNAAMPATWLQRATLLCRAQRITLNTLCQGAWSMLLSLYADRDDVVYGTVVSGRPPELAGADTMVGLFIATVPARITLPAGMPVMDWLRQLQSDTQQAERMACCPLSDILQGAQVPRQQALFETLYVFENYPGHAALGTLAQAHGLAVHDVRALEETHYPLALIVLPAAGLQFQLTYDTARFADAAIAGLAAQLRGLLEQIVQHEAGTLDDLSLAPAEPASAAPPARQPAPDSLLALVSGHARAAPDRVAHEVAHDAGQVAHGTDYRTLARWAQHALQLWRAAGHRPGDRVLLCGGDGAWALAVLLAGLAHGVQCVLPDHDVDLPGLLDAGPAALGPYTATACVATPGSRPVPAGIRCDVFAVDVQEPDVQNLHAQHPSDPTRGACLLVGMEAGEWSMLRYDQAQILITAQAFARACPAGTARHVPIAGPALRHQHLWTALFALGDGLTLHDLGTCTAHELAARAASAGLHWHSVRFGAVQTRRLGDPAPLPAGAKLRCDHCIADLRSLSPAGAAQLQGLAASAALVQELVWPPRSLPHAWQPRAQPAGPGSQGPWALHATLGVVDRNLRPAATGAYGRLTVRGASVPAALLRNGMPAADRLLATRGGALLLTDLRAWHDGAGCQAQLPCATSALAEPDPRVQEVQRRLGRELAVVERLTPQRDWELTVFHAAVPGLPADEDALQIRSACAALGLPAVTLVALAQWPRGARGVDLPALLRGDYQAAQPAVRVAPRDALESALHAIWAGLLKRDAIGVDENYFELGGQSLLASVMLYKIEETLGLPVDMETLLRHPTIAGLARAIRSGTAAGATDPPVQPDLARDAVLADDIVPHAPYRAPDAGPQHVFLTGATGFLGTHLLADLLHKTQAQVHCLVRAATPPAGHARLAAALKAHGLWQEVHAGRIVAVPGQLDQPGLGLPAAQFEQLAQTIDVIYHNGAMVNFIYPYASQRQVNVLATQDVLRMACLHKTKPLHYVSTVGVLNRHADRIDETLAVPLHDYLMGGYEQSKWVAEQLVGLAARRGLPVAIYRPSRIVGHSRTGRINTDDLFCRLIKGIVLFGKAPRDTGFDNMLPVDLVSRIIIDASLDPAVQGRAVHVVNPHWSSMDALLDFIENEGHALVRTDYESWLAALAAHVRREPGHPLAMLIPVLKKLNPMQDPTVGRQLPIAHENMQRFAPAAARDAAGSPLPWLRASFDHFYESGFLAQPQAQVQAPTDEVVAP